MLFASPVKVIEPVAVAQLVGLVPLALATTAEEFTTTVVVAGGEGHPPAVTINVYTPAFAGIALVMAGL